MFNSRCSLQNTVSLGCSSGCFGQLRDMPCEHNYFIFVRKSTETHIDDAIIQGKGRKKAILTYEEPLAGHSLWEWGPTTHPGKFSPGEDFLGKEVGVLGSFLALLNEPGLGRHLWWQPQCQAAGGTQHPLCFSFTVQVFTGQEIKMFMQMRK